MRRKEELREATERMRRAGLRQEAMRLALELSLGMESALAGVPLEAQRDETPARDMSQGAMRAWWAPLMDRNWSRPKRRRRWRWPR